MNKQTATLIAGNFFPSYPTAQVFYITADGQAFQEVQHANMHAGTFKNAGDQVVHTINRAEWEEAEEALATVNTVATGEGEDDKKEELPPAPAAPAAPDAPEEKKSETKA